MRFDADIIIVGGGIGGLTLALALQHKGIDCLVVEAARKYAAIGAGVNLLPHAVAPLAQIGLLAPLSRNGNQTTELRFYTQHGQHIYSEPRGTSAGHAHPQFSLHRANLHNVLRASFDERLGAPKIRMAAKCVHIDQDAEGVSVGVTTENGRPEILRAKVVVGCDGIHSMTRQHLFPNEQPPIFSGITMWRGVAEMPSFLGGHAMVLAGCLRAGKIVAYPVTPSSDSSVQLVNWVAEIRGSQDQTIGWDIAGNVKSMTWANRDWNLPWLDVPLMLRRTEKILVYPMVDRDPLERWSFGRISLLGDAAHPMYPFGSNGACQAILDAFALARHLSEQGPTETALLAYQQERLPPTRDVTLLNRVSPPDDILDEVDRRSRGLPFGSIDDIIQPAELVRRMARYQRTTVGSAAGTPKTSVPEPIGISG
ncbi:FAD-dependent oxidoreductase [Agrobacterium vitis]|uniref:FAD-dependent oxidoreductase n=1 Tax=Allorhizobium ampelinum TaxID=3025782 RepID=UPI001F1D8A92|nr:FAD-dependent oxidoreductase [Allorhizobium ampelinum]MCF1449854.1 FAD-dependent oxidoreductase [Allorhizobium ampelinum]